jgi:hypothetical protein
MHSVPPSKSAGKSGMRIRLTPNVAGAGAVHRLTPQESLSEKETTAHHTYIARHPFDDHERLWGGRGLICLT